MLEIQNRLAKLQSQMSSGWRYDEGTKMKLLLRVGPWYILRRTNFCLTECLHTLEVEHISAGYIEYLDQETAHAD